jgi:hypothetical protein
MGLHGRGPAMSKTPPFSLRTLVRLGILRLATYPIGPIARPDASLIVRHATEVVWMERTATPFPCVACRHHGNSARQIDGSASNYAGPSKHRASAGEAVDRKASCGSP